MRPSLLTKLFSLTLVLGLMAFDFSSNDVLIDFNFQSSALPDGVTHNGTTSTSGTTGLCTECTLGRVNIQLSTAELTKFFQVDVSSLSVFTLHMKSSGTGTRTVTLKYKKASDEDYVSLGTFQILGTGDIVNVFPLAETYPQLVSTEPISVRLENGLSGGEFHIHDLFVVANTGSGSEDPAINATASLTTFSQTLGAPSAVQTYSVSGVNLTENITITPPANYEVSVNGVDWFTSSTPLVLVHQEGTVESTTVSVWLNAAEAGDYAGNIVHTNTGVEDVTVAVTGAASVEEEEEYQLPPGTWTVYHANELPNEFTPAFASASSAGVNNENEIIDDPAKAGNKLLRMNTTETVGNTFLWRMNFVTHSVDVHNLTVVLRAKGNPDRQMALDMDMHYNNIRSRISIHNGTNLARVRTGTGSDVTLNVDVTQWNVYRFVMTATETKVYLNNNAEPSLTLTPAAAASANRHFRFGDGDTGNTFGADIDWVAWDVGMPPAAEPALTVTSSLTAFTQTLGAPSSIQTYTVSGNDLEGNITVTPPANYEVSVNGENWFTNSSPLMIAHQDGTVESTPVSIRLNATEAGSFSGNITHTSNGAETKEVAVTGTAEEAGGGNDYELPAGVWTIYHANQLPDAFDPPFAVSGTGATFRAQDHVLVDDPDKEGNKLLRMNISGPNDPEDENALSQFLWRMNFVTHNIDVNDLTVVIRAKGKPDRNMVMDLDMHYSDLRSRISIHNGTNLARVRNGSGSDVTLGVDVTQWNVYRVVMTSTDTKLYLNSDENPSLVFTPQTSASGNRHFRFGDGDSNNTFGADIDWVAWDVTGGVVPGTPAISTLGTLNSFSQTLGEPSASQSYTVSGSDLTADITITPPAGFEVSTDGSNWFTNSNPLVLTPTGGEVESTPVSVRLNADEAGFYSGNIVHASAGATNALVAASGSATSDDDEYELPPGTWTIYHANELPNAFTPVFVAASGSFRAEENEIIDDPDKPGNKLLRMSVNGPNDPNDAGAQSAFLWRMNFANHGVTVTDLTVVMRAKGNPDRNLALDLDMHYNDLRSRVSIFTANDSAAIRNGTGDNVYLDVDVTQWNIYRFVMTATETKMYLNNNAQPSLVFTPQASASTNRHFRFGDGDSANKFGADIDWIAWDVTGGVVPGNPVINTAGTLSAFSQLVGTPSTVQTYTVSGDDLTDNITITPPANYEVSANGGTTWFNNATPLVLNHTAGSVAVTTISVRLNASSAGSFSGSVAHSSAGATTINVAISGSATATPTINVAGSLTAFVQEVGSPSAVQTYTVSASNLTGNITITPPVNYEVSSNGGTTWQTNATTLTLVPTGGVVPNTTISVRLNASSGGAFSGNISHTSPGATAVNVAVTGEVTVVTSLRENPNLKLTLTPNPASDKLTLQRDDPGAGALVSVYSITGIRLATYEVQAGHDSVTMDISSFSKGFYFVEYVTGKGKRTLRLVKN